jgi:copper homeostasis protein
MEKFVAAAGPMEVTLHRAIDICSDPFKAVDQAIDLGITRILTSGGAKKASDGHDMIRQIVDRAAGRITIMAGSGVTAENVAQLVVETGVRDVHGSCGIAQAEAADVAAFGFMPATRQVTDATTIAKMRQVLDGL